MRWIIGDVHGMLRPLRGLLDAVRAADESPRFLFAGDYVNRGPDSKGVIDLLLALGGDARFVRGNHDDIFDQVVNGKGYASETVDDEERLGAFAWFMNYGLDATLASYGAKGAELERVARRPDIKALERVVEVVPDAHRRFVRDLPPVIEEDDLFVAHAKWEADEPDSEVARKLRRLEPMRQKILWGRYTREELAARKAWKRRGYFGHTPTSNYQDDEMLPVIGPKIVLLDTAAALVPEGRLTAFCADTHTFLQVDRDGRKTNPA